MGYTLANAPLVSVLSLRIRNAPKYSSEADDYSWNAVSDSPFRVLLVNKVIVGRPHTRRQNAQALTKPPHGFHSVRLHLRDP